MTDAPLSRVLSAVADEMLYLLNTPATGQRKSPRRGATIGPADLSDDDLALLRATIYYAERRRRSHFLPANLLGEPGWDILLDLFIAAKSARSIPTTSACVAADVPPTTALRWLDRLEAGSLIERKRDPADARRVIVRLTRYGLDCMTRLLLFDRPGAVERLAAEPDQQSA